MKLYNKHGLNLERFATRLAADLGKPVHIATISRVLRGKRQPSNELFGAMVRVLDGNWDDLVLTKADQLETQIRALVHAAVTQAGAA